MHTVYNIISNMAKKDKLKELVGRNIGAPKVAQPTVSDSGNEGVEHSAVPTARPSVEIGTKEGETRATFICNKEQIKKMKYIAMMSDRKIKDELSLALEAHIAKWEKVHGEIPKL